MTNVSNISSEEELLQLRAEGKISDSEYGELLNAMHKQSSKAAEVVMLDDDKYRSKHKLGKIAFYLMLAGIVVPIATFFLCFAITGGGEGDVIVSVCFFLCVLIEIPAFVIGVISWPDAFGKATVITLATITILAVSLFVLSILSTIPREYSQRAMSLIEMQRAQTESAKLHAIAAQSAMLKSYPLDDAEGLITQSGVAIDKQVSSDGHGSLRVEAGAPTTVRLFETGYIGAENARLIYQARLRTENVEGPVYLEMWCHFPGKGEFFSKGLTTPLTGTTDWTTVETPFFLKEGENPDNVKLNLVIDGKGTVWIDEIRLLKGTLQ